MTNRRKFQRVVGQLGVLSVLTIGGGLSGSAWANITIVKQAESVTQNAPPATLPSPTDSRTARTGASGDSQKLDKTGQDTNAVKDKILVILQKMFDGNRSAAP